MLSSIVQTLRRGRLYQDDSLYRHKTKIEKYDMRMAFIAKPVIIILQDPERQ